MGATGQSNLSKIHMDDRVCVFTNYADICIIGEIKAIHIREIDIDGDYIKVLDTNGVEKKIERHKIISVDFL